MTPCLGFLLLPPGFSPAGARPGSSPLVPARPHEKSMFAPRVDTAALATTLRHAARLAMEMTLVNAPFSTAVADD